MSDACVVYCSPAVARAGFTAPGPPEQTVSVVWRSAEEILARGAIRAAPIVLITDRSMLERASDLRELPAHVVIVAVDDASHQALGRRVDVSLAGLADAAARTRVLDVACQLAATRVAVARMERKSTRNDNEFRELARIGMGLMQERDQTALLHRILQQGKRLTESDGGGLLLVDNDERGAILRPVLYEFDSLPGVRVPAIGFPLDGTSVVGHAALTKQPIVIADVHALPPDAAFDVSRRFERRYGYHAQSMLVVPMIDRLDRVMGVLFFINHKSERGAKIRTAQDAARFALPYTDHEVRLARSLASQAAVSIENTRLYAQIEQLLESFVKASVTAIDQRDPTTAGHSLRVAALTTGLAEAVERAGHGAYLNVRFTPKLMRELRFAALLHDFGKITVREDVLIKAKKLPPALWERVDARFDCIRLRMELDHAKISAEPETELTRRLAELDRQRRVVRAANEPSVTDQPPVEELRDIAERTFKRADGRDMRYLMDDELHYLQLARGTLDERERAEIESHVAETYQFLASIPWTDDLKDLATYAYGHHEKLDGSGYPRKLRADGIPLQTRLITLADMFDALTESDRPYKPAVAPEKALEIMQSEATAGHLDAELVTILAESQVYRRVLEEDWRKL